MKYLFMIFSAACLAVACKKDLTSETTQTDKVDSSAIAKTSARFINGPYGTVTGHARVFKTLANKYIVQLDSFNTNNGPDLQVYLSREIMPVNFVNLGKLKSTNGSQTYEVPDSILNLMQYKYVCIHCRAFNHLFGYANIY
ncbi:MAG: hypothetical protein EAY75_10660 [Bacteroidetes bacterium]|nr:MAG: hypothetical protein EAY75_10660 [Bacteroidota bacterium]